MGNILKLLTVTLLGAVITFTGIAAIGYWIATPLSFTNVLAFVYGYFVVLRPMTRHWSGFLVFLAEYKTIKAQMEERKKLFMQFHEELQKKQASTPAPDETKTEE